MEMIGIYAAFTATANNQASIQVPRAGRIKGISYSIFADLDADLELFTVELSLLPVFQSQTNNTRNLIWNGGVGCNLTTSGAVRNTQLGFTPLDLPVTPLQILYVNGILSGTANASLTALLHFQ